MVVPCCRPWYSTACVTCCSDSLSRQEASTVSSLSVVILVHVARRVSQFLSVRELWTLSGVTTTGAYVLRRYCSFTSRPARLYFSWVDLVRRRRLSSVQPKVYVARVLQ